MLKVIRIQNGKSCVHNLELLVIWNMPGRVSHTHFAGANWPLVRLFFCHNPQVKPHLNTTSTNRPKLKQTLPCVFHQRSSSIKARLPSMVVFHQRSSSIKGCLPWKVVFHWMSSLIKGCLPSNVLFHRWLSSIQGSLSSQVVFHQRLITIGGCCYQYIHHSDLIQVSSF